MIKPLTPSTLGETNQQPQNPSDRTINPAHLSEWVEGSAVDESIASLAIESLNAEELNERIRPGTPIETGGWWCQGVDWRTGKPMGSRYGQGKPDQPHKVKGKEKKPAKYMTPSGVQPDALFLPMPDSDYWLNVYSDKTITRCWTEGAKKAGAGLTIDLATIAVTGVWNWGKHGEPAPNVAKWFQPGTNHVICFDQDYIDKKSCRAAIKALVCSMLDQGVSSVKIAVWAKKWKGMDDFIKANGGEAFKEAIANAITLEQWEEQFSKPDKPKKDRDTPTPKALADILYEKFRERWAYDLSQQTWRIWNNSAWEKRHDKVAQKLLKAQIDAMNIDYPKAAYIKETLELLSLSLLRERWESFNRAKWIAGVNGILNVEAGKVEPHQPGYGFTSVLPHEVRPFQPARTEEEILQRLREECPETYQFFNQSMLGDKRKVLKLVAVVAGILKFRLSKLQRFIHLIGEPGTGKGTFMRLLKDVVGADNYKAASLTNLSDGSTMARIIDAQLVVFPDERKQVGVELLLKLTGEDDIDYRKVYSEASSSPFHGSIVVASNNPVFTGDTTGLDRRLSLIPFKYIVPDKQRDSGLQDLLKAEVPELVSVALSMPLSLVDDLICGHGIGCMPDLRWHEWQMKVETCKVAAFIEGELVPQDGWEISASDLFNAYLDWAKKSNHSSPGSQTFFGGRLAKHLGWLGWDWEKRKTIGVNCYRGFRLRGAQGQLDDSSVPTVSEELLEMTKNGSLGTVELSLGTVEGIVSKLDVARDRDSRDSFSGTFSEKNKPESFQLEAQVVEKFSPETIPTIPIPEPEGDSQLSLNPPQGQSELSLDSLPDVGDAVRYCGKCEELRQFGLVTMTIERIVCLASSGDSGYDMVSCRLPGGAAKEFLRNTLRKVNE
jgi:putative DNA primase/helicase